MVLFSLSDHPSAEEAKRFGFDSPLDALGTKRRLMGKPTGEFRRPRAGEWFLSGAIPRGYRAFNDLNGRYHILELIIANKRDSSWVGEEGPSAPVSSSSERNDEYVVRWELEVRASSHEEAAREARKIQTDPDSIATVFSVTCAKTGAVWNIDLEDDEE